MTIQDNIQIVKDFFAAMGSGDQQGLLALSAENIEWIIPGKDWHAGRNPPRASGIATPASDGFCGDGDFVP